jgi:predicted SAM-dependent methyltransferase
MAAVRVNIACGNSYVEGWVNLDYVPLSPAVIRANLVGRLPLDDAAADVVYSSHFFEHIPRKRVANFLAECFRVVKPGGVIRLVLPDLDELCREYLRQRDAGAHNKADFVVLEMLDQCVRTEPGGELNSYYENLTRSDEGDMMDYVAIRTGDELSNVVNGTRSSGWRRLMKFLSQPSRIWGRLERIYCRSLASLLPAAFLEQNVSFAGVGERHAWIYDFHTLSGLLEHAGFVFIKKMNFDQSEIEAFPFYPLDIDSAGRPRKGLSSMYVEARKP